ncbi:MAG TPA: hypothetical protein VMA32_13600 [Streptosporangiaceae bacterium]|nr:hypothetical protein [Streptosporangiaceae bacterium]
MPDASQEALPMIARLLRFLAAVVLVVAASVSAGAAGALVTNAAVAAYRHLHTAPVEQTTPGRPRHA